jgi:hypothetical protein
MEIDVFFVLRRMVVCVQYAVSFCVWQRGWRCQYTRDTGRLPSTLVS